jgi:hypothetical protein
MQSSFLPWRGYFDLIEDVEVFYLYDDVAFVYESWRNRNRIKTEHGCEWITVPVQHEPPQPTIDNALIVKDHKWAKKIINKLTTAYCRAPYFNDFAPAIFTVLKKEHKTVSLLNEALLRIICEALCIRTEIRHTRPLGAVGKGEDRVFDLMKKAGITFLVNGPTAEAYSTHERYRENGIGLAYKTYDYDPYPQLYGEFEPQVTVLDLLFNTGPRASAYLKSRIPNREVVKAG